LALRGRYRLRRRQETSAFANKLLGTEADRGDFIGVERTATARAIGTPGGNQGTHFRALYWTDQQNANWCAGAKRVGQA